MSSRHIHICVLPRLLVFALILQLLVAGAGAAAPSLHHFLHHDSNQASHECAITLMAAGGVESPLPPFQVVPIATEPDLVPAPASVWVASIFRLSRVFERGPPVA